MEIGNKNSYCSAIDCLSAMYYYAALKHLNQQQNTGKDAKQEAVGAVSNSPEKPSEEEKPMSNSLETFDVVENDIPKQSNDIDDQSDQFKSNETQGASCKPENESANAVESKSFQSSCLSHKEACFFAHKLLWNSQVRKLELQETLLYIQRAMSALIAKHKPKPVRIETNMEDTAAKSDVVDNASGNEVNGHLSFVPQPSILRTPSGEYLHMKPGAALSGKSPLHSPRKLNFGNGDSCEKFEEMMPAIAETELDTTDMSASGVMTQSGIIQTRIYTKAHNIFSTEMAQSTVSISGEADDDSNVINFPDSDPQTDGAKQMDTDLQIDSNANQEKDGVPDGKVDVKSSDVPPVSGKDTPSRWHLEPVDRRYQLEGIGVPQLSQEQQRVTSELHDITCMIKVSK